MPGARCSGTISRPTPCAAASTRLRTKSTVPAKLSIVSGTLLNEKMPFLAQPMLRRRLFVVTPNMRFGPHVVDARLAEADEGAHAAQEEVALVELQHRVHDAAVDQREVAGVARDREVREAVEGPVEGAVGALHEPRRLARDAPAVDDVVALPPLLDELLDQLGRILEIAVEQHERVLRRELHAAAEGRLRAEVARVRDAEHAAVALADRADDLLAVVGARVVDEDDLVVDAERRERVGEPPVHDRDRLAVPVAGDDGRDAVLGVERDLLGRRCGSAPGRPGRGTTTSCARARPRAACAPPSRAPCGRARCWRTSRRRPSGAPAS